MQNYRNGAPSDDRNLDNFEVAYEVGGYIWFVKNLRSLIVLFVRIALKITLEVERSIKRILRDNRQKNDYFSQKSDYFIRSSKRQ